MVDEVALGFADGASERAVVELAARSIRVRAGVVTGMPWWWVASGIVVRWVRMPAWRRLAVTVTCG